MDSYETIQCSSFNKVGKNTKLMYDECKGDSFTRNTSTKPMKYYTSDFFHQTPCESSNLTNLTRGILFTDGHGRPARCSAYHGPLCDECPSQRSRRLARRGFAQWTLVDFRAHF